MSCARYRAQISRYLDDELSPRQRSELLAHIKTCAECAAALARFRQSEVLLKKLPETRPSEDIRAAVLRAAHRRRRKPRGWRGRLAWWLSAGGRVNPGLSLGALAVAVVLCLGALIARTGPTLPAYLGLAPAPSPTSSYLDVPASATPRPGSAFAPRLVSSAPFDGEGAVDVRRALTLRFDQAMDRRSVERAFRLDPAAPGAFAWDADNELRFIPADPGLLRGITYTVALSEGAHSLGGATLPPGPLASFVTLEAPRLLEVSPAPGAVGVAPTATLVLTFSRAMDPAGVEDALRLSGLAAPDAPWQLRGAGQWSEDGTILRYGPIAPFPAGQVDVLLGGGGQDQLGGALAPAAWSFQVAAPDSVIAVAGPRLLLLPLSNGNPPAIEYDAVDGLHDRALARVDFTLYALPRERFVALLPWLLADRSAPAAGPWPSINLNGLTALRTWADSPAGVGDRNPSGQRGRTPLPVREPGFYLLTADTAGAPGDQRVLVVSEAGAAVVAAGDQWLVWSGDLAGNQGTGRGHVRLFAADGTLLVEGEADADGLFSMPIRPGVSPALALVERGDAPAVALLDTLPADTGRGPALNATFITDRPVYAPGDTVNFTAIVPAAGDQATPVAEAIQVRLRDPAERVLSALVLKPDNLGAVAGSFALAPGLAAGRYSLELEQQGAVTRYPVPVQPAPPPAALQLLIETPVADPLFAGDTYTPTLTVLDPLGAPVPGVVVTLTVAGADPAAPLTATTDLHGQATVALRLPPPVLPETAVRLRAVTVDGAGRAAQAAAEVPVAAGRLTLALSLAERAYAPGGTAAATALLRDAEGRPVADQPVTFGLYVPDGQPDALTTGTGVTDAQGTITATLPLAMQGSFVVRATSLDATGALAGDEQRLWVYAPGSTAFWAAPPAPGDLLITPDQAHYAPGAAARLLVQPGAPGAVLVLTSLDGIPLGRQVATLPPNGGVVTITVPPGAPDGAHLTATFLRFVGGSAGAHLHRSDVTLPVEDAATRLRVELELDQASGEYHPGNSLLIHARLRDSQGGPVAGQVTLALAPTERTTTPAPPAGAVLAGSSWADLAPAPPAPEPSGPAPAPVYWNTTLQADAGGHASASLPAPAPGRWRVLAWGFAPGGLAGRATTDLAVRSSLDLGWNPPAHLAQGDTARVGAVARNVSTGTLNADVRLRVAGAALRLDSPALVSLSLAPGEARLVEWTVVAGAAGDGQLTLEAGWGPPGGAADGRLQYAAAVRVAPYGIAQEQTQAGVLAGDETFTLTLPRDAASASATLDIRADPTLGGLVADSAAALLAGEAGQGSLPNVAGRLGAGAALSRLGRTSRLPGDSLPDGMSQQRALDLQYLYGAQRADGAWGVLPGAPGDVDATAAVLEVLWLLSQERAQGGLGDMIAVDPGTVERAVAWLRGATAPPAVTPGAAPPAPADPTLQARAFYVLSLYQAADRTAVRPLMAGGAQLRPVARGWLALALERLGAHDEAVTVLAGLPSPGAPGSDTASALGRAVALLAVPAVDPGAGDALAARLVPWLLAARQGATWPGEGATATAVQALAAWAERYPTTGSVSARYRVLVNGQLAKEVLLGPRGSGGALRLALPGTALRPGANEVRLVADGDLTLYYSLRLTSLGQTAARPLPSDRASGFVGSLLRDVTPASGWRVGAPARITLTLTLAEPVPGFQIVEPLPGAWQPLGDYTLARADKAPPGAAPPVLLGVAEEAGALRFRLDALAPGTYHLGYTARLAQAGQFQALPALGSVPDAPARWARSAGRTLAVER